MIQSKQDYENYLKLDRISTGYNKKSNLVSKIKDFFFPSYEWQFIKALRWLEYCENVRKKQVGGDCPKTHKLESVNFQFATDDSTFSQLRSCFDFVCRIKQQNHDTTVSD